ncbi:MAG TPA: immunoglobulin domain-containing protein [Anaerohalosphaeraceae bacterium]|nr:immunoglobulin domain-containing protein [Anaerohalosphaeraceae bacterium]
MKQTKLFLMMLLLMVPVYGDIVGSDFFNYPDGPVAGRNGGYGWDWKGVGKPQGPSPTSWLNQAGITNVVNGTLSLQDSGAGWISARREFGSDTWGTGAFQNVGIVYFAATLTINAPQGWLGISAQDGEWGERVKFGMPWQTGGLGYLGVNNENNGQYVLTNVQAVIGRPYRIVGVLDYNHNAARMWVDPDTGDYDIAWNHTSADAVFNNLNMWNWVNGVRIASGAATTWDDVIIATTFPETFVPGSLSDRPHNPQPASGETDVPITASFVWTVPQDPNGQADPNLVSMKLYMKTAAEPNFAFAADILVWDAETLQASYTPSTLSRDTTYYWRVDTIYNTASVRTGDIWIFETEKSVPIITGHPAFQIIETGGTATFTVTVVSISTPTYQWFKYVDGQNDIQLSDGGDISGVTEAALAIANAKMSDEGLYYCIVNNESGIPAVSGKAPLAIKRRIAYWPFEENNPNSTVPGSPVSLLYGDPVFTAGIVGSGMEFDNNTGAEDMLYTDPDQSSYFDICNYSITVACWIKAPFAANWGPMVARNGESGQGWQLRHRGDTLNKICFTTRGTANDDGTASNRTVYDNSWHYAVGTFDGSVKKVYIDGVLSRVYSRDDGRIIQEYDEAAGVINSTLSPVSLAGRVRGSSGNLIFEGSSVTPCVLDEVEIYNYPLDAATIAQTYADITGKAVCPAPVAYDLDGDCIVDLGDFVKLASEWLLDTSVQPAQ